MGKGLSLSQIMMLFLKQCFSTFPLKNCQYSGYLSVCAAGLLLWAFPSPSADPVCSSLNWFTGNFRYSTPVSQNWFSCASCLVSPEIFPYLPQCLRTAACKIMCCEQLLHTSEWLWMSFWSSSTNLTGSLWSSVLRARLNGLRLSAYEQEWNPSVWFTLD